MPPAASRASAVVRRLTHPPASPDSAAGAAARAALAAVAFGVVHSLLAGHRAKRKAEELVGERGARGWYRFAFNGVSVGMTLGLVAYVVRHRGPVVYSVRGPAAWVIRAGQVAALGGVLRASAQAGFGDLSGVAPAWRWATGRPLGPIPDGQGPAEREPGEPEPRGLFTRTSQPTNFFSIPVLWLEPRPSAGRLAVNAVFTAYLVVGSWHADRMLARRHGAEWDRYRRTVPLLVPG